MSKKIFLLFIIVILMFFVCLGSVSAFSIQSLDEKSVEYNNGKSIITVSIVTDNVVTNSKMKNDLNTIEKIVIKIDGKTINTIKKDKTWNKSKYYPMAILDRSTIVKGKIKGKTITILTYDKKDKIIKTKKNIVKSVYAKTTEITKSKYPKNARLTYKQAFKIVTEPPEPTAKKITYLGYHYLDGDLFWSFKCIFKNGGKAYFGVYDLLGSLEAE